MATIWLWTFLILLLVGRNQNKIESVCELYCCYLVNIIIFEVVRIDTLKKLFFKWLAKEGHYFMIAVVKDSVMYVNVGLSLVIFFDPLVLSSHSDKCITWVLNLPICWISLILSIPCPIYITPCLKLQIFVLIMYWLYL